jgi:sulfite reductase alpha subunit-like flavoprotein/cytochrome b involved in lipid metabolism
MAPARSALLRAEAANRAVGNENLGFMSERRGFMPLVPPAPRLPDEFAAWDQVAGDLPRLLGSLRLRGVLDALPVLAATPDRLPDQALLRACHLLAMLAHAYQYVESQPPAGLPQALSEPWSTVRRRLDRPDADVLSYIDLIVYNFRLVDPAAPDPFRVENMRLLTPTVDTPEERIFYLTQTEILAQTAPVVGAIVRAQEAILADDADGLGLALALIGARLRHVVRTSLPKIDPNPSAPSHVNPVVWAKTVAPFAVPMGKGVQGPSGTSSPLFNLLDAFFGRKRHDTFLGKEIRDLRRGYPLHWRELLAAVGEVSTADYVVRRGDAALAGLWAEAVDAYVGQDGFLGRHRMKVYGYLELAFKVGRSVTIGGFAGLFKDRTWDQVDGELEHARRERLESFPESCRRGAVRPSPQTAPDGTGESVRRVVLDVDGAGLRYEPGDRCGVLAENGDEIVARTLAALRASGDEPIALTDEWRAHLALRPGLAGRTTLRLHDLLRCGRIRPVVPRVAEALHAVTQHVGLKAGIAAQTTARWELWELLLELAEAGHDVSQLWRAAPTATGYISRVVPPENFRLYSISSAMAPGEAAARELELTVGLLRYAAPDGARAPGLLRAGTASRFLGDAPAGHADVPVVVRHPARFGLPADPRTPIVMIAAGTGIAPFVSFIRRRAADPDAGPCWLYWGLRSRADFVFRRELADAISVGRLQLKLVFSREPVVTRFVIGADGTGDFTFEAAPADGPRHVDELLASDADADSLGAVLAPPDEGGMGAHLYVCGRSSFARAIEAALRQIFARRAPDSDVGARLAGLAAEGRYAIEVYSEPRPDDPAEPTLEVSEIIEHNDEAHGHWLVLDRRVYDLTAFLAMHPGGVQVLRGYAGMDATQGYLRAHRGATDVDAVREMYAVGKVRALDFRGAARPVERTGAATHLTEIAALYRAWVNVTYLAVEMQNALRNDLGLQRAVTARDEAPTPRSPYKLERLLDTQTRFLGSYANGLIGAPAIALWELAEGLYQGRASTFMRDALDAIQTGTSAQYAAAVTVRLRAELADAIADRSIDTAASGHADTEALTRLRFAGTALETVAGNFLAEAKALLRQGLVLFERHEAAVLDVAGPDLLALLRRLPELLEGYLAEVRALGQALGLEASGPEISPHRTAEPTPEILAHNRYWLLELDAQRNIVVLRRSAAATVDLADLVAANEQIISHLPPGTAYSGAVVDTRQAPPRNDVAFEAAMRRMREQVCRTYARVAVIVVSAAGALQVSRLGRDDEAPTLVTHDEDAALRFAMGR